MRGRFASVCALALGAVGLVGLMIATGSDAGQRGFGRGAEVLAQGGASELPDTVPLPQSLPPANVDPVAPIIVQSASAVAVTPAPRRVDARVSPDEPRRAAFAFTGDTLVHSPVVNQARRNAGGVGFDFAPMFARVAPILGAVDVAACHLETPVAPAGEALSTYPLYGIPADIAVGLASAGYDRCSTASNHALDRRATGIDATIAALDAAGVAQSGMARTAVEAIPVVFDVNGIAVAHLSYTFDLNGLVRPRDEPWRTNRIDDGRIVSDAEYARSIGAEVVIVSVHWGTEGVTEPNQYQRDVAAWITATGAVDLVIGHHAHVPQPIERINGVWVVFGLGNFLSNMPTGDQWPAETQDGVIVTVEFSEHADGSIVVEQPQVLPTWVDRSDGFVIRPVLADLADPLVADDVKVQLRASFERTAAVLGDFIAAG